MGPSDLASYYSSGFGNERQMQGQIVNARVNDWALCRLLDADRLAQASVLDVGSGYGFFLDLVRRRTSAMCVGVELSAAEARFGRETLGLDIREGLLSQAGLQDTRFDLVTTFEVIEHVLDPIAFVTELAACLKPGGHMLVMTDNFESRIVRSLGAAFPKWIPHQHISHFGPDALERVLLHAGMSVVARLSFTPWEFEARALYNAAAGRRPSAQEAFSLEKVTSPSRRRGYRFFRVRRLMNRLWAQATCAPDLSGAVMFALAKKAD